MKKTSLGQVHPSTHTISLLASLFVLSSLVFGVHKASAFVYTSPPPSKAIVVASVNLVDLNSSTIGHLFDGVQVVGNAFTNFISQFKNTPAPENTPKVLPKVTVTNNSQPADTQELPKINLTNTKPTLFAPPLSSSSPTRWEIQSMIDKAISTATLARGSPQIIYRSTGGGSSGLATALAQTVQVLQNNISSVSDDPTFDTVNVSSITAGTASTTNFFGAGLSPCQSGNVVTFDGAGKFGCAVDATGSGGSSGSKFATSTNGLVIYPNSATAVVIGASATTTLGAELEVIGDFYASGSTTLQNFTFRNATGTSATTTSLFATSLTATTASTTNLFLATSLGCLQVNSSGQVVSTGTNCASSASSTLLADNNGFTGNVTFSKFVVTTATSTNLLAIGSTTLQNFTFLNATGTSATTTNFFATTLLATNATTTAFFSTNASTTNLFASNGTIGTLTASALTTTGLGTLANLLVTGSSTLQKFTFTNATGTNATTTAFNSTTLTATNATTTSLFSTNASSTNFFTNIGSIGSLTTGSIIANVLGTFANLLVSASSTIGSSTTGGGLTINGGATTTGASLHLSSTTLQNFTFVNATGTNATTTTFNATTLTAGALTASGAVIFSGLAATTTAGQDVCYGQAGGAIGNITHTNGTTACSASSRRFKQNINNLTSASGLAEIMALTPVSFRYTPQYLGGFINDSNWTKDFVGFIAEDVAQVDARLISTDDQGLPVNVQYPNITAILTKAMQEQQAQIVDLQNRIGSSTPVVQPDWTKTLGVTIENSIAHFANLIVDTLNVKKLNVGDSQNLSAAGITILDRVTGQPVCVYVESGVVKSGVGECGQDLPVNPSSSNSIVVPAQEVVSTPTDDGGNIESNSAASTTPVLPPEEPSSTSTATTTPTTD